VATFEVRALDFLMKPVDEALDRVSASVGAADDAHARGDHPDAGEHVRSDEVIAVSNVRDRSVRLLSRRSVLYAMAYGDYLRVFADSGRYLMRGTLTDIERRFGGHGFMRVHRQYVVNLRRVVEVRPFANGTALVVVENGGTVP